MTTDRIPIACPHCQRELRIRAEYAGRKLVCNHCRETFEARLPGQAAENAPPLETAPPTAESAVRELELARAKITQLRAQRQALAEEVLKAKNILGPLRHRVKDLEDQLDHAKMQTHLAEEELRAGAPALAELDRLRVEAATLGPRAAEAVRLEDQLAEARQENDRLRRELDETRQIVSQASEADAPADTQAEEIARLQSERDEAVRTREQIASELELVRAGFKQARDEINRMGRGFEEIAAERARLEEERAAVSRMRDELQGLIDEQRRSLARREAELDQLLEQVDLERAKLESQLDDERARMAADFAQSEARHEQTFRRLEAELEQNAHEMQASRRDHESPLAALRRDLELERANIRGESASLRNELAAARQSVQTLQSERDRLAALHEEERQRASEAEQRVRAETDRLLGEKREALSQLELKSRLVADLSRRTKSLQDQIAQAPRMPAMGGGLPARPQATQDEEPAAFRTRLQIWLDQAAEALAAMTTRAEALQANVRAAREELDVLNTDLALGAWDEDIEQIAFPFEEG